MNTLNLPNRAESLRILQEFANQEAVFTARKVDKPLVLYGAGDLGKMAKKFFDKLGIQILSVVDANPEQHIGNQNWAGITIMKPDDVSQNILDNCLLAICISKISFKSVTLPLIQQGWRDIVPFYDITEAYTDSHPLSNGWYSGFLNKEDIKGIEFVLKHLNDDISRAHHLQFIAWHLLRKELVFNEASVSTDDRFFISQITSTLHDREVFLDGGAYIGKVSQYFMNEVHNKFLNVFTIEPDKYNVNELHRMKCSKELKNIKIIECALGQKSEKKLFFHGLDYASQLSRLSNEFVNVRTIDDLNIPVTFIKLHLEGWEYEAVQGSLLTFKKYRPLLTTTIYHNRKGLWKISLFLMKNLEDYVFFIRLHSWLGTGCVLYAIPRERFLN